MPVRISQLNLGDVVVVRHGNLGVVTDRSDTYAAVCPIEYLGNPGSHTHRVSAGDILAVLSASAVMDTTVKEWPRRAPALDLSAPVEVAAQEAPAPAEKAPEFVTISVPDAHRLYYGITGKRVVDGRLMSVTTTYESRISDHHNRNSAGELDEPTPRNRNPVDRRSFRVCDVDSRDVDLFLVGIDNSYVIGSLPKPPVEGFTGELAEAQAARDQRERDEERALREREGRPRRTTLHKP